MRLNGYVFLNLSILNLGVHLGLTTSPHTPFPTGYVTSLVYSESPPLQFLPSCSREQMISECIPDILIHIPTMLMHPFARFLWLRIDGRTIGYIHVPFFSALFPTPVTKLD